MTHHFPIARAVILLGLVLLTLWLVDAVSAGAEIELKYPKPCNRCCVPNARFFGYYEPVWRRWPCESHLAEENPRVIGHEVIATPKGFKTPTLKVKPKPQETPEGATPGTESAPSGGPAAPGGPGAPGGLGAPGLPLPNEPAPGGGGTAPGAAPGGLGAPGLPLPGEPAAPGGGTTAPGAAPGGPGGTAPGAPGGATPSSAQPPAVVPPEGPSGLRGVQPSVPEEPPLQPEKREPPAGTAPGSSFEPAPNATPAAATSALTGSANASLTRDFSGAKEPASEPQTPTKPQASVGRADGRPTTVAVAAAARGQDREAVVLTGGEEWAEGPSVRAADYAVAAAPMPTSSLRCAPDPERAARRSGEPIASIRVPPVALQGYCPVELARRGRWMPGDVRWTVVYRGRIYRLSGAQQRRQFLADPEKFVPANAGNDVVVSVGQKRLVPGQPAYCAIYRDRVYLFSSAATQAEFNAHPNRYAVE
jgi:YHS domain-containing protein